MTRFPVLVLLQAVAKDSAWNSDVKGILVFCRFPKTPKLGRLQEDPASHPQVHRIPAPQAGALPGRAVRAIQAEVPAWGTRSSGQHKAPAVQERICLSSLWQERTLGPFSAHRSGQTGLCSPAHKRALILPSAGRPSAPPAAQKTREQEPRTRELQFGCCYCLIVWPQSLNLSVPSSLPGKGRGSWVCPGRAALPGNRRAVWGSRDIRLSLGQSKVQGAESSCDSRCAAANL